MQHSITVALPEQLYRAVVDHARRTGQAPEEFIANLVVKNVIPNGDDPLLCLAGTLSSETTDIGARHDDYLGEEQMRKAAGDSGG